MTKRQVRGRGPPQVRALDLRTNPFADGIAHERNIRGSSSLCNTCFVMIYLAHFSLQTSAKATIGCMRRPSATPEGVGMMRREFGVVMNGSTALGQTESQRLCTYLKRCSATGY